MALGAQWPIGRGHAEDTSGTWLPLLVIERSDSKNRVHYDIVVDDECRPLGEEPIRIYWRLLEDGPHVTERLNWIERTRAYGLKFQTLVDGWVHFRFKAYPERLAKAHTYKGEDGRCHAEMWAEVDGGPAIVERVWVKVTHEHWWKFPKVPYVDVFAHSKKGEDITERIAPD